MQRIPLEELSARVGADAVSGSWLTVDQARIDLFAEATGDDQFIHVDPERAARTPFGTTIAHGFLSLSLIPHLVEAIATVPEGTVMGINYGLDKVRFLEPVRVGSEIRARSKTLDVIDKGGGRILVTDEVTVEIRGAERPALVAQTLSMFVIDQPEEERA